MNIVIDTSEENSLKAELEKRTDFEALRIRRYLSMPDLSRSKDSPLAEIVQRAKKVKNLEGFDDIKIPEITPTNILFDLHSKTKHLANFKTCPSCVN
jgi:hypothetical protein